MENKDTWIFEKDIWFVNQFEIWVKTWQRLISYSLKLISKYLPETDSPQNIDYVSKPVSLFHNSEYTTVKFSGRQNYTERIFRKHKGYQENNSREYIKDLISSYNILSKIIIDESIFYKI